MIQSKMVPATQLPTREMLERMPETERQSILFTAFVVQEVLLAIAPKDRPAISNVSMANLAYAFRVGNFKSIPFAYNEHFTRGLYRHLVQAGLTAHSEPMMDEINSTNELCSAEELVKFQDGLNTARANETAFDFGVLDGESVASINNVSYETRNDEQA